MLLLEVLNQCARDRRYDFKLNCKKFYHIVEGTVPLLKILVAFDLKQDSKPTTPTDPEPTAPTDLKPASPKGTTQEMNVLTHFLNSD
jgi:hypothetical protein